MCVCVCMYTYICTLLHIYICMYTYKYINRYNKNMNFTIYN